MIKILFYLSGISVIAGPILSRTISLDIIKDYSYIWLGFISILFFFLLVSLITGLFVKTKIDLNISFFIIIAFLVTGYSLVNQGEFPIVKKINITSGKLVSPSGYFSVVQLSDLHIEHSTSLKKISKLVNTVNGLKPDLIVLTGDIIEFPASRSVKITKLFKNLKSKYGVYAVTGNHEYYVGIRHFYEFAEKSNIKILENEVKEITPNISLSGIDDIKSAESKDFSADNFSFLSGINKKKFNIFLAHRPFGFVKFSSYGIDLQLSGHTHAGQIPPMDLLVQLYYKYPYGLYSSGKSYIYTTSGTGFWGPPMRFLSKSEIVYLKINNKEN